VQPLWEEAINRDGGKWIIVVNKSRSAQLFTVLLQALVSTRLSCEIVGIVLSKKSRDDLVSLWTPSGQERHVLERLRDEVAELISAELKLKPLITFMYHDKKLQDHALMPSPSKRAGPVVCGARQRKHSDENSPTIKAAKAKKRAAKNGKPQAAR